MNPLLRLLAVGALLTASVSIAADAFQGKVNLLITPAKGKAQTLNYSIKDQKLRMDIEAEGHPMAMIMDMEKLEMLILDVPQPQSYMVMPIKKPVEKAMEKHAAEGGTADVELTGKTDTILGYKCNQLLVKDKDKGTVTEVWAAEGLGTFMGLGSPGGGGPFGGKKPAATAKWEEALKGKGGFPLRVISTDAKGKESFRMEATKIEPGTLSASLFAPPAGYQQFKMPDFGGMNPFKKGE